MHILRKLCGCLSGQRAARSGPLEKGREWEYDKVDFDCLSCGNGCSITVSTKDGSVTKVSAGAP